jgi:hypothetical protein
MELDRPFAMAEFCPGKKRQTKVDRRGIEGIDGLFQLDTKIFVGIETSGFGNQDLSKVGVDPPIADLIGMRQGIARNFSAEAHMIELLSIASKAGLNVPEAFSIGELGKSHAKELIHTGKGLYLVVAPVSFDTFAQLVHRQEFHELGENGFPGIHEWPPSL